jgi:hypothetical protein
MRLITFILVFTFSLTASAQEIFKDFFKYSTIYTSVNGGNSVSDETVYDIKTGTLLNEVVSTPYDYTLTLGIRKIQRFQYEPQTNFKDGTETSYNDAATIGRVKKGFEYLFEVDYARQQGTEFINQNHFLRYNTTKWMAKVEFLEDGFADIKYFESSQRARINSRGKLSFNVGACQRISEPYGFNPLEEWMLPNGTLHYTQLALDEGYTVNFNNPDNIEYVSPSGNVVANSVEVWEAVVVPEILANYVDGERAQLQSQWVHSVVVGFDYYKYKKNIWLHAWGNVLPYHYNDGGEFSYHNFNDGKQWLDYSAGMIFGYKINKNMGAFVEGKYNKYWDREWYNFKFGVNYKIF